MENIKEKSLDDQDFLFHYGSIRSGVPSKAYKDGWNRIFATDRAKTSVDVPSDELQLTGDK